ncbi:MAG: hypothetical protein ACRC14_15530, partial [Paracoccaceae bacterium]
GILASPAVRKTGLFGATFAAAGLTPIYAEDEEAMLATIRLIKAQGPVAAARAAFAAASADLLARGAQVQMIACTEFSLIADAVDPKASAFDTLDQLTKGILSYATSQDDGTLKAGLQPPIKGAPAPEPNPNKETTP